MLIFLSFFNILIFLMYLISLVLGFSSFSWFFIWISFEVNLFMYMMMYFKLSQNLVNSLMKYFIVQSISSNLFFMSVVFLKLNSVFNYFFMYMMFLTMWMKIGFYPFMAWFFQISEMMEWGVWFLLNSFQKVLPLLVISMNFLDLFLINLMVLFNSVYMVLEMLIQVSMRWFVNCSSMIHFSWLFLTLKKESFIWQFYFVIYLFTFFFLFKFLVTFNIKCFINLAGLKSLFGYYFFSFLVVNFMGLPPFLGFFSKLVVLKFMGVYFMLMVLLLVSFLSSMVYFYFMSFFMTKGLIFFFNNLDKNFNFLIFFYMYMLFYFFLMVYF